MSTHIAANSSQKPIPKAWLILWLVALCVLAAMLFYPIRFGSLRLMIVLLSMFLWLGVAVFAWRHRVARFAFTGISIIPLIFLALPGRAGNANALRQTYVSNLQSLVNTPYVWGGETHRGIDCSGLLRCALWQANWKEGIRTANPELLREAAVLWWSDASAKLLGEEYAGRLETIGEARSLNTADYKILQPGDIAVTSPDGVHCLAYIGNQTWVEADPSALVGDKVIAVKVPTDNAWFTRRVKLLRWKQLQSQSLQ